jgi:hypothetical protein
MEIVAEVRQLQQERKNYETTKERKHKLEHPNKDSDAIREHEAALHCATRKHEHYHSWLSSQIVLDSMHADDIRETGHSDIPDRNKRPIYPGYLRSEPSDHLNKNATPGPSHPRVQPKRQNQNKNTCSDRRSRSSDTVPLETRRTVMGDPPSNPNDSSSSDTTYRPQQSESGAMTTASSLTPTSNEDGRREHHARQSDGHESNHDSRNSNGHRRKRRNARNHNSGPSEPSDSTDDYS